MWGQRALRILLVLFGLITLPRWPMTPFIDAHYPCRLSGMKRQIAAHQTAFLLVRRPLLGRLKQQLFSG